MAQQRLLLISNSFSFGQGYLEHCRDAVSGFLGPNGTILFIPFALADWAGYTAIAREGFGKMGISVVGIHEVDDGFVAGIRDAEAIFVGGGNTFRLLNTFYHHQLLDVIKEAVENGVPYLGASAGSNVACPTIKTTNDMPIVWPPSCIALNLFPYQINPHYLDPDPASKHMGETRDKRIAEFLEENDTTVIGMREGSWIVAGNGGATLCGTTGAKLFVKGAEPREWEGGLLSL
ncbi:MAG: dipeptidase PepE [Candidatus Kerfeldbacteria bacterium]